MGHSAADALLVELKTASYNSGVNSHVLLKVEGLISSMLKSDHIGARQLSEIIAFEWEYHPFIRGYAFNLLGNINLWDNRIEDSVNCYIEALGLIKAGGFEEDEDGVTRIVREVDYWSKAHAQVSMAGIYAISGAHKEALSICQSAHNSCQESHLDPKNILGNVTAIRVKCYARLGCVDDAKAAFEEGLSYWESPTDHAYSKYLLAEIAHASGADDFESLVEEAITASNSIEYHICSMQALELKGLSLFNDGERSLARSTFETLLEQSKSLNIGQTEERASGYLCLMDMFETGKYYVSATYTKNDSVNLRILMEIEENLFGYSKEQSNFNSALRILSAGLPANLFEEISEDKLGLLSRQL